MRNNEPLAFLHSVLHFSFEIAKIAGVFFVAWWRNLHPPSLFSRGLAENEESPSPLQRLITISSWAGLEGHFKLILSKLVWSDLSFIRSKHIYAC